MARKFWYRLAALHGVEGLGALHALLGEGPLELAALDAEDIVRLPAQVDGLAAEAGARPPGGTGPRRRSRGLAEAPARSMRPGARTG